MLGNAGQQDYEAAGYSASCSQEAERNECLCSALVPLFIQHRIPDHGNSAATYR